MELWWSLVKRLGTNIALTGMDCKSTVDIRKKVRDIAVFDNNIEFEVIPKLFKRLRQVFIHCFNYFVH